MNLRITLAALSLALIGITGCRKDPINALSAEERRIYITNRDESVNFSNYRTFSIADNVVVVNGSSSGQQSSSPADQAFIQAAAAALESRGFVRVERSASPDLGVQVSRIIRTSTGIVSIPDYYGYWDPFFWGGGGGFGPGFGGWGMPPLWRTATYQVQEGMLAIDIVDIKNAQTNNNLRVIWNGMIRGAGINNASTAGSQVNQLFEQSSYLRQQ
jgi:hypothetical protein